MLICFTVHIQDIFKIVQYIEMKTYGSTKCNFVIFGSCDGNTFVSVKLNIKLNRISWCNIAFP
jgi:hypothetical protein